MHFFGSWCLVSWFLIYPMSFEKKKIQTETLSEYLLAVRENLGLSREEVSRQTGIKLKFLENLESGDFKALPAEVYVLGFLSQLAKFYSVDPSVLNDQYKKEQGIQRHLAKPAGLLASSEYKKFLNKIVITPKVLSLFLGVLFVLLTVGYIIWQVWSINKTPGLQILEPANNSVIAGAFVTVRGSTDPGMIVSVNDQNIFVDNNGNFNTQLGLTPGPKEIVISAKNRFDKSVSKTVNITGASPVANSANQLALKIDFTAAVSLNFVIDDQAPASLQFAPGDTKTFIARQKILLSTSDAGATHVSLNGQDLGPLGRAKEQLNNIPFLAQTAATTTPLK